MNSTLLASVIYDVGELVLQLEFCNGAIYRYFAVPAAIHDGLLIADSKGSYFNRQIRNGFRYALPQAAPMKLPSTNGLCKIQSKKPSGIGLKPAPPRTRNRQPEGSEKKSPSFARMHKAEPYATASSMARRIWRR